MIVLTGHGSIDLAVRAIKEGAEQFLTKPVDLPALLVILQRLARRQDRRSARSSPAARERRRPLDPFLGTSAAIRTLAEQARKVLDADRPILIQGETGSGKGVLAAWLHANGPRADEAFVDLNCAGLTREFLESELFGHERGAFTGAVARSRGSSRSRTAAPSSSTRSATSIRGAAQAPEGARGEALPAARRRARPPRRHPPDRGEPTPDLAALARDGRSAATCITASTRSRWRAAAARARRRCCSLARALLGRVAADMGRGVADLAPDAEQALRGYPWPGNIRELRNVLERAVLLGAGGGARPWGPLFDGRRRPRSATTNSTLTLGNSSAGTSTGALATPRAASAAATRRLGVARSSLSEAEAYGQQFHPGS